MVKLGYTEGRDYVFESRYAMNKLERLQSLAAELVALHPDIILGVTSPAVLALKAATSEIPIVMLAGADPVARELVESLARPGGNVTGVSVLGEELTPKVFETLLSVNPKVGRVAVLLNPSNKSEISMLRNIEALAQRRKLKILPVEAQTSSEIESAFLTIKHARSEAVIVFPDPIFYYARQQIADLAIRNRIVTVFQHRQNVEAGAPAQGNPQGRSA
ncbi:MAG: ABC transporter substrate-binding protein [Proteobacteria bacterium]|nr:ABC transporter substrate-binding protein [Pseudomonadota bacterium]